MMLSCRVGDVEAESTRMPRMTEGYVEAQCQGFRRMWEAVGNKTRMRWRVEAESKMLDGITVGKVVGCVDGGTGMLSLEVEKL